MAVLRKYFLLIANGVLSLATPLFGQTKEVPESIYQIQAETIDGHPLSLSAFRGNVLLIVNVASRCGFTSQYKTLQELYSTYKERGFTILAFPSNDFFCQEPGTNQEIHEFCNSTYQITFPLFAKIQVIGSNKHPLYQFLTSSKANPEFGGVISWNFNKFLISREGKVISRFGTMTPPDSPHVIQAIEKAL